MNPLRGAWRWGCGIFSPCLNLLCLQVPSVSPHYSLNHLSFFVGGGENIFFVALPILLFVAMAGLIISFLFTYSEYYIVLRDYSLVKSIMESAILVIANLKKTILVFVLMLLIGARIVLNVLLVLLIPMMVVGVTSYLATIFLSTLGMVFIGLVGFAILIVSSYLLGLFHIFATAVWVLTFAELTERGSVSKDEGE